MNVRLEGDGKFWELVQEGKKTISAFGKLGSTGKTDSQVHSGLATAHTFCEQKFKEKLRKGYKQCGVAKVCPFFLQPKHSSSFTEGTITNAKNGSPSGMAYECEAQVASLARKDCKGYFVHKGYQGQETYHLLIPSDSDSPHERMWKRGSHGGLVKSVRVKSVSALVSANKDVHGEIGTKASVTMKKPAAATAVKDAGLIRKAMKPTKLAMKGKDDKRKKR